ncbi:MAG: hypothetical protein ACTSVW_07725 [Candidatus Njordarchaeales archaeon]
MPKDWVVLFGGEKVDSSEDFTLNFVPLERLLGNYRSFDVKDFDAFVKKMRKRKNYRISRGIKKVLSPEEEDFTDREIFALLGIDKDNLRYGFLLLSAEDEIIILGVWPIALAEAIMGDDRIIPAILTAIFMDPKAWKRVDLVFPSRL